MLPLNADDGRRRVIVALFLVTVAISMSTSSTALALNVDSGAPRFASRGVVPRPITECSRGGRGMMIPMASPLRYRDRDVDEEAEDAALEDYDYHHYRHRRHVDRPGSRDRRGGARYEDPANVFDDADDGIDAYYSPPLDRRRYEDGGYRYVEEDDDDDLFVSIPPRAARRRRPSSSLPLRRRRDGRQWQRQRQQRPARGDWRRELTPSNRGEDHEEGSLRARQWLSNMTPHLVFCICFTIFTAVTIDMPL